MSRSVCLQRYPSYAEALTVRSVLEAHGFTAELDNFYHAGVQPYLFSTTEGLGVLVPEQESVDAIAFLEERQTSAPGIMAEMPEPYEKPRSYGRISAWVMLWVESGGGLSVVIPLLVIAVYAFGFLYPQHVYGPQPGLGDLIGWLRVIPAEIFWVGLDLAILILPFHLHAIWRRNRRAKIEAQS